MFIRSSSKQLLIFFLLLGHVVTFGMNRALIYRQNKSQKILSPQKSTSSVMQSDVVPEELVTEKPLTLAGQPIFPSQEPTLLPEFGIPKEISEIIAGYMKIPLFHISEELLQTIISYLDKKDINALTATCSHAYFSKHNQNVNKFPVHTVENKLEHKYHFLLKNMCMSHYNAQFTLKLEKPQSHRFPWAYSYSWPYKITHKQDQYTGKDIASKKQKSLDLFDVCKQQNIHITNLVSSEKTNRVEVTPLIQACFTNNANQVEKIIRDHINFIKNSPAKNYPTISSSEFETEDDYLTFCSELKKGNFLDALSLAMHLGYFECLQAFVSTIKKEQKDKTNMKTIVALFTFPQLYLLELAIHLGNKEAFNILSKLQLQFDDYFFYSHNDFVEKKEQFVDYHIENLREMRKEGSLITEDNDEEFEQWMNNIKSYNDYKKADMIWKQFGGKININMSPSIDSYYDVVSYINQERKKIVWNGWNASAPIFEKEDNFRGRRISCQFYEAMNTNNIHRVSELISKLEKEQFEYSGPQRCEIAQRHLSWINRAKKAGLQEICFRLLLLRIRPECSCKERWEYPYIKEKLAKSAEFFIPETETSKDEEKIVILLQQIEECEKKIAILQQQTELSKTRINLTSFIPWAIYAAYETSLNLFPRKEELVRFWQHLFFYASPHRLKIKY